MDDSIENVRNETEVHINMGISPIYADDIVQFNFERGVSKILLAQRFQNELTHTNTIALPLETLLTLKHLLNSEEFTKAANDFINRRP